jgi:hypothetical protein
MITILIVALVIITGLWTNTYLQSRNVIRKFEREVAALEDARRAVCAELNAAKHRIQDMEGDLKNAIMRRQAFQDIVSELAPAITKNKITPHIKKLAKSYTL